MEKIHNLTHDFSKDLVTGAVNSIRSKSRLLGKVATSIFTGVFGTVLIVLFLTTFIRSHEMVQYIPWIIAFNAAVTGYSLLQKTRDHFKNKQLSCIGAGILNIITAYSALSMLFFYSEGEYLLGLWGFLFSLIIGVVFSELGALLAIKYFNLNK